MMEKFLDLLKQSVLVQAALTLIIWVVIGYLYATGQVVPEALLGAGTTILGFYFGSKSQNYLHATGVK